MQLSLTYIIYAIIGMLGISIMILIHELGHLIAARICKIEVETVQFGFGPAVKTWQSKKRETKYQLGVVPFGGFCRMKGQDDLTSAISKGLDKLEHIEEGSIYSVNPLKRIFTYACGPLFNIIFSILCYSVLLALPTVKTESPSRIVVQPDYASLYDSYSTAAYDAGLRTGDEIISVNGIGTPYYSRLKTVLSNYSHGSNIEIKTKDNRTFYVNPVNGKFGILPFRECIVADVEKNSPEYRSGLRNGDRIVKINDKEATNMFDLLTEAYSNHNINLKVIDKEGEYKNVDFVCVNKTLHFSLEGISVKENGISVLEAVKESFTESFRNFVYNIREIFSILDGKDKPSEAVSGSFKASQEMGMMMANSFKVNLNNGIRMVFFLLASVSMSLAVANLLPVSAFDGGLILISLAELIAGHTFKAKVYVALQIAGLVAVFAIFVLIKFL